MRFRMTRIAILIDGGHLRVQARKASKDLTPSLIEKFAHGCRQPDEDLLRVLYYDCAPYNGKVRKPVSNELHSFSGSDGWLHELASKDYFAVRRGVLKFRGWVPKRRPLSPSELTDDDFTPSFEQKGVDMRIGLDVATFAATRAADRIFLISNDTDCVPAMKHARISGLQIVLVRVEGHDPASELKLHSDFVREAAWPDLG